MKDSKEEKTSFYSTLPLIFDDLAKTPIEKTVKISAKIFYKDLVARKLLIAKR